MQLQYQKHPTPLLMSAVPKQMLRQQWSNIWASETLKLFK